MEVPHYATPRRSVYASNVRSPRPVPHLEPSPEYPTFYSAPSHRSTAKALRRRPLDFDVDLAILTQEELNEKENDEFSEDHETASFVPQFAPLRMPPLSQFYSRRVAFHALHWDDESLD